MNLFSVYDIKATGQITELLTCCNLHTLQGVDGRSTSAHAVSVDRANKNKVRIFFITFKNSD